MSEKPPSRGRPKNDEPGSRVTTWIPSSEHDKIIKLAEDRGESVSSMVRLLLLTRWRRSDEP